MGSQLSAEEVAIKYGGKAEWYSGERPRHSVSISKPFYMQTTEVTVGRFRRFVDSTRYRTDAEKKGSCFAWSSDNGEWEDAKGRCWKSPGFYQTDNHPVVCVSWNDATAFADWLNRKEGTRKYRLPTEAEWECSARAGSTSVFPWGEEEDRACVHGNTADETTYQGRSFDNRLDCSDGYWFTAPVGKYRVNSWGLYDMTGNVWEWCQDWYGGYPSGSVTDPIGPSSGSYRVLRGGGWFSIARHCRSANRSRNVPDLRSDNIGFRLVRIY